MKERSWSIRGQDQATWMRQLRLERDNFRRALRWAVDNDADMALRLAASLSKYWEIHGDWTEGRRWLERVVAGEDASLSALDLARAQQAAGTLAMQQEDHAAARPLIEAALVRFQELGDSERAAWALNDLAIIALDAEGNIKKARDLLADCLELADPNGAGQLAPLINLGWLAMEEADWEDARVYFKRGLELAGDDLDSAGWCWLGLATLDWLDCRYEEADQGYAECVRLWREIEAESTLVFGLIGHALVARDTGDLATAAARTDEALAVARHLGGGARYVFCLGLAGSLLAAQGRLEEAAALAAATNRLVADYHWPVKQWFRADIEKWEAQVEHDLDEEARDRARAAGADMSVGDALRMAEERNLVER